MFFLRRPELTPDERSRGSKRRWTVYPLPPSSCMNSKVPASWTKSAELSASRFSSGSVICTSGRHPPGKRARNSSSSAFLPICRSGLLNQGIWRNRSRTWPGSFSSVFLHTISLQHRAATRISEWGAKQGYVLTETAFAVVAALVRPEDPELAFAARRVARRHSDYARATDWFKRATGLARRADDDSAKAAAYLGWGIMEAQRGRPDEARRRLVRAWRSARRGKLRALTAAARHNLIAVTASSGIAAYKLYGDDPPLIAQLAVDAAALWSLHSYFAATLRVSEAAIPYIERPAERLQVLANIARSVGKPDRFFAVWYEVSGEGKKSAGEFLPQIYLDLAEAARTFAMVACCLVCGARERATTWDAR
jgi:hypothetical protein